MMANDLHEALARFNVLPDDAVLPSQVTAIILGVSERTTRYHPQLPRVQISIDIVPSAIRGRLMVANLKFGGRIALVSASRS